MRKFLAMFAVVGAIALAMVLADQIPTADAAMTGNLQCVTGRGAAVRCDEGTTGQVWVRSTTTGAGGAFGKLAASGLSYYSSAADVVCTGSSQSVAHSLVTVPSIIHIYPVVGTDGVADAGTNMPVISHGTHTTTNVVFTCSAGAKVRIFAVK